jgi:hypothetical protein
MVFHALNRGVGRMETFSNDPDDTHQLRRIS